MPIGQHTIHLKQVTSTNDIAWAYTGDKKNHGLMVVADEQTAGRGRRGDVWVSPPGSALYMSILLHPELAIRRPVMLTIWAGLGVCQVIQKALSIKPQLKWPNDVLIDGKKVSGILVEQRQEWFVVGVGLNVNVPVQHFHAASVHQAGSLQDFTKHVLNRSEVLSALQSEWNQLFTLLVTGKTEPILELWKKYSGLVGHSVNLEAHGKQEVGTLHTLRWEEIVIESEGKLFAFQPEAVTRLVTT
ncbi:MAG TPA: biotin--[acetyl-CoA-carboxylase] ligase [Gemmatales bacterium]|nr:biotin--[acetyl-CoA-carboxylase] ligase [Gemmatales bacterium]